MRIAQVRLRAAETRLAADKFDSDYRDAVTLAEAGLVPGIDPNDVADVSKHDLVLAAFAPPPPLPSVADLENATGEG